MPPKEEELREPYRTPQSRLSSLSMKRRDPADHLYSWQVPQEKMRPYELFITNIIHGLGL